VKLYYDGPPLEEGDTSISSAESPAVRRLVLYGHLEGVETILDYGAGRDGGRNTKFLRKKGFKVFSFDPFHGTDEADGWTATANRIPSDLRVDVSITSFVLNVVPFYVEQDIIKRIRVLTTKKSFHIVRSDILSDVQRKLPIQAGYVFEWYVQVFGGDPKRVEEREIQNRLAVFGYQSKKKGFQRACRLQLVHGMEPLQKGSGYKIYEEKYNVGMETESV
jgi:hypothetical protein